MRGNDKKQDAMFSCISPEQLLRALLLQILYSVRSERMLMEQLDYNLLFRWFVGLNMDDRVWNPTTFTKNRERLLSGRIAEKFLVRIVERARAARLLSDEHFRTRRRYTIRQCRPVDVLSRTDAI